MITRRRWQQLAREMSPESLKQRSMYQRHQSLHEVMQPTNGEPRNWTKELLWNAASAALSERIRALVSGRKMSDSILQWARLDAPNVNQPRLCLSRRMPISHIFDQRRRVWKLRERIKSKSGIMKSRRTTRQIKRTCALICRRRLLGSGQK